MLQNILVATCKILLFTVQTDWFFENVSRVATDSFSRIILSHNNDEINRRNEKIFLRIPGEQKTSYIIEKATICRIDKSDAREEGAIIRISYIIYSLSSIFRFINFFLQHYLILETGLKFSNSDSAASNKL